MRHLAANPQQRFRIVAAKKITVDHVKYDDTDCCGNEKPHGIVPLPKGPASGSGSAAKSLIAALSAKEGN